MNHQSGLPFAPHVKCPHRAATTGSWRTFRPVINQEKCNRCLLCWVFCPDGVIKKHDLEALTIDLAYCKGCGICAHECRRGAITMFEEENNG